MFAADIYGKKLSRKKHGRDYDGSDSTYREYGTRREAIADARRACRDNRWAHTANVYDLDRDGRRVAVISCPKVRRR